MFFSCFTPVGCLNGIWCKNRNREHCAGMSKQHFGVYLSEFLRVTLLLRCRNWRQWPDTPARWTRLCFPTSPSSCWPSACSSPPGSSCILLHNDWCWFAPQIHNTNRFQDSQLVHYWSMVNFFWLLNQNFVKGRYGCTQAGTFHCCSNYCKDTLQ